MSPPETAPAPGDGAVFAEARKPIRGLRWYIAALLCVSSELNYLDRQTLSVLASTIQQELGLTTVQYSYITSSFLLSYTIMYAVSGKLIDIFGTRRSFLIFVSGWSMANMLHALARTTLQFSCFRFLLGVFEPGNFPGGVKAISEWFPLRERAMAVGIFNAGTAFGSALAAPLVSFIALTWGWRAAFVLTGALGFLWVAVWFLFYRLPQDHPRLGQEERDLILSDREPSQSKPSASVGTLLRMKEAWGCILARVLTDPISYFIIFWMPKYLQDERGFNLSQIGKYAWIPFCAMAAGNILGGVIPRLLIARGFTLNRARKSTMLVVSLLMPVFCLLVTLVESPSLAVALISAMAFGHGCWHNITLPAEVFPRHAVATVSGFGGALGGVMGVITQQVIGHVVQDFSFAPIFSACAIVHLVAFVIVHKLVGELGRIRPV